MNLLSIAIVNNNALKSNNIGTSINPQIAASGNNVYVTWTHFSTGLPDISFRASNNNGTNFGTSINIFPKDKEMESILHKA